MTMSLVLCNRLYVYTDQWASLSQTRSGHQKIWHPHPHSIPTSNQTNLRVRQISRTGQCICGAGNNFSNEGQLILDAGCASASGQISTDNAEGYVPYVFIESGNLGDGNQCLFNDNSNVLGSLLGNGFASGAIKGTSSIIEYDCNMPQNHGEVVISIRLVRFDNCGGEFSGLDERTYTSPADPMAAGTYPDSALCRWKFTLPAACTYRVNFLSVWIDNGDYIFLKYGDTTSPDDAASSHRIGDPFIGFGGGGLFSFPGGNLEIEFASNDERFSGTGLSFAVSAECKVVCSETTVINLQPEDLTDLSASDGDVLYIAPSWDMKPDQVNQSCVTTVQEASFTFHLGQCGYAVKLSTGEIAFIFTVWNAKQLEEAAPVQRYFIHSKNFTCLFASNSTLTSGIVFPELGRVGSAADPVSGQFIIDFTLFDNDRFADGLTPGSRVTVPDDVYARVELSDVSSTENSFVVQLTECWATRDSATDSEPIYPIIASSCRANNDFESPDSIEILRNYEARYGQFKFKSFVWSNFSDAEQSIYVHCEVTVCNSDVTGSNCSSPGCSRKRREIGNEMRRIFSAGPIALDSQPKYEEKKDEVISAESSHADIIPLLLRRKNRTTNKALKHVENENSSTATKQRPTQK